MMSKWCLRILCVLTVAGCSLQPAQVVPEDVTRRSTITDVSVASLPDGTQITVKADGPLNYTAFQLEDPPQLVVDLAEVDWGAFGERRDVGLDPVQTLVPEQAGEERGIARLNLLLSRPVDYEIRRDETGALVIGFTNPAMPSAEAAPAPPPVVEEAEPTAVPATESPALPLGPPHITAIRIVPQQSVVEVHIESDGPLSVPRAFPVGNDRLVIDVPDAMATVKPSTVKAETNTLLRQVRIGQHRDPIKTRVVLDLKSPVTHTIDQEGSGLKVQLTRVPPDAPAVTAQAPETAPPAPVKLAMIEPAAPPPTEESVEAEASAPMPAPVEPPGPKTLGPSGYSGQKISLDFQDAEVSNVLRLIADVSGLNMVVGEEVKGKVTLKLFNVPWDQSLDIILKSRGLGQLREGNIIRIDTNTNIAKQQEEAAKAKEAQVKAEDLKTLIIPINYAKASDLSVTLKKNLSSRGELTVNEATNSLIAKDVPQNMSDIQQLIKLLDLPSPQVLIETRIVQANTNFARDLGVQWGVSAKDTAGVNQFAINAGPGGGDPFGAQVPNFGVNLPASGGAGPIGNVGFTLGRLTGVNPFNLDLRLSAGEATGETKIISSPRIVTMDNKEAAIQQGDSVPFETVSDKGTQTQFVDATLNLTVTPHITPNGSVIMKIKATKNAIGDFRSRLGAPSISKREASTEVMVQDGETTVIGGIFEATNAESETGVPWFSKIPLVGWLFKRQSVSDQNRELLIFITPTIVKRA